MTEGNIVTGESMLGHIDEIRMSRIFNVKVQPFPGTKIQDMFPYLVSLQEKMLDYVILHVGTNNAIYYEVSDIIKKILQVKQFIKLKVLNCKVIISRLIKKHDNKNTSCVIEEAIS